MDAVLIALGVSLTAANAAMTVVLVRLTRATPPERAGEDPANQFRRPVRSPAEVIT